MHPLIRLGIAASLVACSSSTGDGAPATTDSTDSAVSEGLVSHSVASNDSAPGTGASPRASVSSDEGSAPFTGTVALNDAGDVLPNDASSSTPTSPTTGGGPEQSSEAASRAASSAEPAVSFPVGDPAETAITAVPSVRQEHAVVALNDEIYVLGGFTPSATATVQAYSPAKDTWRDIADFPVAFHHPNVGAVDGKLYVAGFLLGSSLSDGDGRVFAYDPNDDEWTPRTSMPAGTDRGSACVTTLGTKLYVFGGAGNTTVPDVSAYDTVTDAWQELTFMPELREHCVAAAVDGLIYIVSGRAGGISGVGDTSFAYDPQTDTYEERAKIPTPRGGTAGALLHGRIFVFGGEGNAASESGVFKEIEAYDPRTDTWHSYPPMTVPRHGFGAATVGERIYLPGGGTEQGFGSVADHTVFTFNL